VKAEHYLSKSTIVQMGKPSTFELIVLYYKWESRGLLMERCYITNVKAEHYGRNGTLLQMGKPKAVQVTVLY